MMHVARETTKLGTFSEEEVRRGLVTGQFLPADLGWRAGMPDWLPLSAFPELGDPSAAAVAPPFATGTPAEARPGLPWEHRKELGNISAFVETVKIVLMDPAQAFSRMRLEGGLLEPFIFRTITVLFVLIVMRGLRVILPRQALMGEQFYLNYFSRMFHNHPLPAASHAVFAGGLLGGLLGVVLALALGPFLGAAIIHLFLMLVGGAKKSYETTFRVLCFARGSVGLLAAIPVCGGLIVLVWQLISMTIGLSKTHDISTGRALAALLIPFFLCCGALALVGFVDSHALSNMR